MENETEQELIARVYDLDGQDYEQIPKLYIRFIQGQDHAIGQAGQEKWYLQKKQRTLRQKLVDQCTYCLHQQKQKRVDIIQDHFSSWRILTYLGDKNKTKKSKYNGTKNPKQIEIIFLSESIGTEIANNYLRIGQHPNTQIVVGNGHGDRQQDEEVYLFWRFYAQRDYYDHQSLEKRKIHNFIQIHKCHRYSIANDNLHQKFFCLQVVNLIMFLCYRNLLLVVLLHYTLSSLKNNILVVLLVSFLHHH